MRSLCSLLLPLVLLSLAGCPQPMPSQAATVVETGDLVLRAYDVPAATAPEVQSLVRTLLQRGKDTPAGNVGVAPGGQLLVAAPASFHAGMGALVEHLRRAPPAPPPSVTLDYWVVAGVPAEEASVPAEVVPEVASALEAVLKSQGPMRLQLFERLRATSLSGDRGSVQGSEAWARQAATVQDGKVIADVDLRVERGRGGELHTRIAAPLGKILVLGQAGAEMRPGDPFAGEDPRSAPKVTLFYLVRASVADTE